jgi:hypothetical protein
MAEEEPTRTEDQPGLSDQYPRASPWPLFVAGGLTLSEVGVVFGSLPVSVGGILLLSASVVGILRESGFSASLWKPALGLGVLFGAAGGALLAFTAANFRGSYVLGSGLLLAVSAVVLFLVESGRL